MSHGDQTGKKYYGVFEDDMEQKGNQLRATLTLSLSDCVLDNIRSQEYLISSSSFFSVRVEFKGGYVISVSFRKKWQDDNLTYLNYFSSSEFMIKNRKFVSDNGEYHIVGILRRDSEYFDVAIRMDILPSVNSFAALHGDLELTDFELRGQDGGVRMHRAVLAAFSPFFKTMLGGTWKETKKGCVKVPGTSLATLQNFKDYMYLHTLPESGVEELLLLAQYYMIPDLEQICVSRLVDSMTAQTVGHLLEFAHKHNIMRLVVAILERAADGGLNIYETRKHLLGDEF